MTPETGKLILVVDDDEGIREFMTFLLTKQGHRVETAVDGEDAARKTETLRPDLIVLDLMLPRYGGFELLRHLQNGALARVPIIIVTGRYTDRSTADLIRQESNVVELIEKPVMNKRFVQAVERVLSPERPDAAGAPGT
jgi:two-component system alkaline phosphatase synthesis response regulator PhoP